MEAVRKFTNVQIELLKLFQYDLPEKQLAEIKNLLAKQPDEGMGQWKGKK